jgi:hypothetical protein
VLSGGAFCARSNESRCIASASLTSFPQGPSARTSL